MSSPLARDLRRAVRGEVLDDDVSLGIYATDASLYEIRPLVVVVPRDADDARAAVRTASEHGAAILPRGGGTSLAGQTVGRAVVLDFSKSMNRLLELDVDGRWARVEPGLVRDELNTLLEPHGLHFAPDPATSSRANVGGMIGNNSSGTKSILYGKTIDHVLELEVLLASGHVLHLGPSPSADASPRETEIVDGLRALVDAHRDEIAARFPKTMRRVGGYPLDELLVDDPIENPFNPAKILVGSEGTLGVILSAKIRLEPLPRAKALCVAHFESVLEAVRAVEPVLPFEPSAVEILDRTVLRNARKNPSAARLCDFLVGEPDTVLLIEFYGETAADVDGRAASAAQALRERGLGHAFPIFRDLDRIAQARVWEVRKAGLGLMLGVKGDRKPLPFIEDAAIPIPHLPEYVEKMLAFCAERGVDMPLYAHASVGVLHLRPMLDLRRAADIELMRAISEHAFELTVRYGGSWSSEHGDGLVRSEYNERFFGARLYQAFRDVKELFDPRHLMNPGKIVDAPKLEENLRYGTSYHVPELETIYQYRADGSFAEAVEMCSGVGQCRKTGVGVMCPSYMATRDEEHSTRGRANALRLAMAGRLDKGLDDPRLGEALDLCLSCKACKSECPSNVDMAKLKGEYLQWVGARRGRSLRDHLIAHAPDIARLAAGPLAPLINRAQRALPVRRAIERFCGFAKERQLPSYAHQPFMTWWRRRPPAAPSPERRAALFVDTYLGFHEPQIGRAAVDLLEACGYEVIPVDAGCCQRPRISNGFLIDAKAHGERTLRELDRFFRHAVPVLVLEPSCASALVDDLPDLVDDAELAARASKGVHMLDTFLAAEFESGRLDAPLAAASPGVAIHGHCHQKALFGTAAMRQIYARVEGLETSEIAAGCCGMAGAFGYEAEHLALSKKIGEDRLFPAIRTLPESTTLVACGFSCRHQIEYATGRRAVHWVETVRVGQGA